MNTVESAAEVTAAAPTLRKAARIDGRTLRLRNARPDDAAFILALRSDPIKGVHLSTTSAGVEDQRAWLERYASRGGEAYFVIERLEPELAAEPRIGTVRLYDARGASFCWGSWILANGAPGHAAVESALMVYAYALDHLGFATAHFSVNVENERVWSFHERFGAVRIGGDGRELHYTLGNDAIRASLQRFSRFLPNGVKPEVLS